jgi:hypothetical protein
MTDGSGRRRLATPAGALAVLAILVLLALAYSLSPSVLQRLGHAFATPLSQQDCPVPMPNGSMPPEAASFCHP